MAFDLIVRNATLPDGRKGQDVAIAAGRIAAIEPAITAEARATIDAGGYLLAPPFVDCHFHMDATLSLGLPRLNVSGTLLEGIALWGELKPHLTHEAVAERALRYCDLAVSQGLLAIRSHVDVCDDRLVAVEALIEVKKKVKPYLDLQLVAFPQDGYFRSPNAALNLERALDLGVDVVGGIPHFERTMADGAASVKALVRARRPARVDGRPALRRERRPDVAPCGDPRLRGAEARSRPAGDRIAPDLDAFDGQLLCLEAPAAHRRIRHVRDRQSADQSHASGPPRHLSPAARTDAHRGDARARDSRRSRAGLRDGSLVWARRRRHARCRAYGGAWRADDEPRGDPLDIRRGDGDPARILGLEGYGLAVGAHADMVLLQAADPIEAVRLRATRLLVIRRGEVIARTPPRTAELSLGGRPASLDPASYAPKAAG